MSNILCQLPTTNHKSKVQMGSGSPWGGNEMVTNPIVRPRLIMDLVSIFSWRFHKKSKVLGVTTNLKFKIYYLPNNLERHELCKLKEI